jgi:hypothetical protein
MKITNEHTEFGPGFDEVNQLLLETSEALSRLQSDIIQEYYDRTQYAPGSTRMAISDPITMDEIRGTLFSVRLIPSFRHQGKPIDTPMYRSFEAVPVIWKEGKEGIFQQGGSYLFYPRPGRDQIALLENQPVNVFNDMERLHSQLNQDLAAKRN